VKAEYIGLCDMLIRYCHFPMAQFKQMMVVSDQTNVNIFGLLDAYMFASHG